MGELILVKGNVLNGTIETSVAQSGQYDFLSAGHTLAEGRVHQNFGAFDDAPKAGGFDWGGLFGNILAGLAVVAVVALACTGVGLLAVGAGVMAASAVSTIAIGAAVGGVVSVGICAGGDILSGEVSSTSEYTFAAASGTITGAIFGGVGASSFFQGLGKLAQAGTMGATGLGTGMAGNVAYQLYHGASLNEIDWIQALGVGAFSGMMAGLFFWGASKLAQLRKYFRAKHGTDNAVQASATPSQLAKSWQGSGKYPGVDDYIDVTIRKGTTLYRGEPNGTEYFTTLDAIEQSGRGATRVFEGLQVEKNPIQGYRKVMQGYVFHDDIACAYGIARANPQFGAGGLPQYFVPNVQDLIDKGILVPVDRIKLYK